MTDETQAVILGLCAAVSWGFSSVLVRSAQRYVTTRQGTLASLFSGVVFMTAIVIAFQLDEALEIGLSGLGVFALIGILNFPMGRYFNFLSIEHLGIGRSTPILASSPLFAVVLAVIFIGEELTIGTAVGTALVFGGIYLTLSSSSSDAEEGPG